MDEARALLDQLMGVSRDGEREEVKRKFSDPDICKFYIQNFCYMEEFQRTKHNYGDCTKLHDDDCKHQWEALDDAEKQRYPYERELFEWLDRAMVDLRSKIRRNEERLEQNIDPPIMATDQTKLAEMEQQVKDLKKRSVELAEEGDVDAAHTTTKQAESLETEAQEFAADAKHRAHDNLHRYGEQEVCKFSGVIINSEESRMRDHKSGKNYRAWVRAHEKKQELDEAVKRRGLPSISHHAEPEVTRSKDSRRERSRERHSDRHRGPDRDRDRERDRDRDRDRDGDRDRNGDRHRTRDRHTHSSKDRDRESNGRRRSRQRSRSRERPRR